ncbi:MULTISPECIES: hypothetical protein [unclassified Endozoicomonas]|uniref:hypothetical protein n=1 Tax=unclassified Endozoicomonas TaxID=2644528 RepID=UPI003BB6BB96
MIEFECKGRVIKLFIFAVPLSLLLSLSFICKAEPSTRRFVVELDKNTGSPKQSFSVKPDRRTLPCNPSDMANTESDSLTYEKPHRLSGFAVRTPLIGSITWQWLYVTNLLVGYELILTIKDAPLSSTYFSWIPVEVVSAVGWLLKSCWTPGLTPFNPNEKQELLQDQSFTATNMMFGSGHNQPECQPSKSSGQKSPKTTNQFTGSYTSPLNTDYGSGSRRPQQHLHTLGLNCFVYPCYGACKLRQSSGNRGPKECPHNFVENSTGHTEAKLKPGSCPHLTDGYCFSCVDYSDPVNAAGSDHNLPFETDPPDIQVQCHAGPLLERQTEHKIDSNSVNIRNSVDGVALDGVALDGVASNWIATNPLNVVAACTTGPDGQLSCVETVFGKDGQPKPCGMVCKSAQALSKHKRGIHSGQKTCDLAVAGKDGQTRPCGKVCKNTQSLSSHKSRVHSGQKTCNVIMVGENGQLRACETVCKNAQSISSHKIIYHSGQQVCDITVIGDGSYKRPCGSVWKSSHALKEHKRREHTRQIICEMPLVGEDGLPRPCRTICNNQKALTDHKRCAHSGQKICDFTMVGDDGQPRPCGMVCKSAKALSDHKRRNHSGQQICDVTLVGEDGLPQLCGNVCTSSRTLGDHKRREHSGRQICNIIAVGKDGQKRPCGKFCKSTQHLTEHKRREHSGQQTCNISVTGEDGQLQPCWMICKSAASLSDHKKTHRKRKPVDMNKNDKLSSKKMQIE